MEKSRMAIRPGKKERDNLWRLLRMAMAEDLGDLGDVTSSVLPDDMKATGLFVARQPMVFCGGTMLETMAVAYDGLVKTVVIVGDGAAVERGDVLAEWHGPAKSIMAAERVALNFLQRLSGIATMTGRYVQAVEGTGARIFDTRKTTPGWRELEKYAVRAGGGRNHRRGLYDAVLIKDNHLAVLAKAEGRDPIAAVGREMERIRPLLGDNAFIELEVDTIEQFEVALTLAVDIILLDNMPPGQLASAVRMRDLAGLAGRVDLEASGGVTLDNVREVAASGVERIAVGALTHSADAVDIALDIDIN